MIQNKYVLFAFRLVVGAVFIWSGLLKVLHPLEFAQSVAAYDIFPKSLILVIAVTLPWVEAFTGFLLVLGLFRPGAALVAAGMLTAFIILVAVTMARGLDLSCGCFGLFSGKVGWPLLIQDIVLLFLSLNVLLSARTFLAMDELGGRPSPTASALKARPPR